MKRTLSLILTAVMLFSVVAGVIPVQAANAFNIDEVEAKYFDVKPTIDGYISEAEWGAPVVLAEQDNAQTAGGQYPTPNRFFYTANGGGYDAATLSMSYYLWLSWDENYFYIGAKVNDPDGHSLRNGRGETWDGDALHVRIDPMGANGIVWGEEFYPEDSSDRKPWSAAQVCDLVFGYCLNAGGYKEAWNNTIGVNKGMLTSTAYTQSMGLVDMAVATAGSTYTSDTQNGITTYEIAIPWSYIDFDDQDRQHQYYKYAYKVKTDAAGNITQGPDGAVGYEYGMSACVLNADGASGGNHWNALLTWGSGIAGIQQNDYNYKTCAGSNAIILSGDKVSEDSAYNANYAKYTVGGPPPAPITPNYDFDKKDAVKLTYDSEDDMQIFGEVSNGERVQLEDGNWVVKWDKATDIDYDRWEEDDSWDKSPEPPTLNGNNYLSTDGYYYDDARWEATGRHGPSFTFEFDMMVTDLVTFENGYPSYLCNWFGGTSSIDYQCGYFFDDNKFKIVNSNDPSEIVAEVSADLTLNEWHHWVFQYDNETCTLRFYFDPKLNSDGLVAWDATPIFNVRYRYFDYGSIEKTLAIFRRMNAQIMMDNIQFYNFVDFSSNIHREQFFYKRISPYTNEIMITGYDGQNDYITIPQTIDGFKVVGIAEGAFSGNNSITYIELNENIRIIENGAFDGRSSLTFINYLCDFIECNVKGAEALAEATLAELSDSSEFTLELFEGYNDETQVYSFTPENDGRYKFSMPENMGYVFQLFDENGEPVTGGYRHDLPYMLDFVPEIYVPESPYYLTAEGGKTYYVVVRALDLAEEYRALNFSITAVSSIKGDADGDGEITARDVLAIRKYLGFVFTDTDLNVSACDVDCDGEITTRDVLMIRKYLGGLIDEFPMNE